MSLIKKGLLDGTFVDEDCLNSEQRVGFAPPDGAVEETVELFQTKYRRVIEDQSGNDDNESRDGVDWETTQRSSPPCILPSGWQSRVTGPGKPYVYNKMEILEYNEIQYIHGPEQAKRWADRRWHERDT